jgi:hypothetical protein
MPWAEITHLAHYPMLRASPPPPHILGVYGMWAPFTSSWTRAGQLLCRTGASACGSAASGLLQPPAPFFRHDSRCLQPTNSAQQNTKSCVFLITTSVTSADQSSPLRTRPFPHKTWHRAVVMCTDAVCHRSVAGTSRPPWALALGPWRPGSSTSVPLSTACGSRHHRWPRRRPWPFDWRLLQVGIHLSFPFSFFSA